MNSDGHKKPQPPCEDAEVLYALPGRQTPLEDKLGDESAHDGPRTGTQVAGPLAPMADQPLFDVLNPTRSESDGS